MKIVETDLPDVRIIEPDVYGDDRGFFMETWNAHDFARCGIDADFVQDNHSRSARNVLRGLHYQLTRPQGKLVRVVSGRAFDVAVDIRRSSPNFGQWVGVELSAQNKRMLWVPSGFAHGFLALEERTDFLYKCTDFYESGDERTLLWCDEDVAIDWPLEPPGEPVLSAKDQAGIPLRTAETYR